MNFCSCFPYHYVFIVVFLFAVNINLWLLCSLNSIWMEDNRTIRIKIMSKRAYLLELFKEIADAIRAKTGSSEKFEITELPDRIMDISTGATTPPQTKDVEITANGKTSVVPDAGYVLDRVNINVNVPQNNSNNAYFEYISGTLNQNLKSIDCSNWDTSQATNMSNIFSSCTKLTTLDLSSFNTSRVKSMSSMFSNCSLLTSLDLSSFDTSQVSSMSYMFYGCSSLTTLDLSSFNTSNVMGIDWMFYGCSSLTTLDLSSFNTSNVTNMNYMFANCKSLTTLILGDNWASNAQVKSFDLNISSKFTHDSCLDVFNKLATRTNSPTLKLSSTTKALMSADEIKIATDKGWVVA